MAIRNIKRFILQIVIIGKKTRQDYDVESEEKIEYDEIKNQEYNKDKLKIIV
jgi:hypothetical protein